MALNLIDIVERFWAHGERRQRKAHYPSDITRCIRQLYYRWTSTAQSDPIEPGGWWKMKIGQSVHDEFARTLQEAAGEEETTPFIGFQVAAEVRTGEVCIDGSERYGGVLLEYPMSGRLDVVFSDEDGTPAAAEMKTKWGRGVVDIRDNGLPDDALAQAIMYTLIPVDMPDGEKRQIERVYLPIVSRDNAYRIQFAILRKGEGGPGTAWAVYRMFPGGGGEKIGEYDWSWFEKWLVRLAELEGYLKHQRVPPRDYRVAIKNGELRKDFQEGGVKYKSDWQCMYCPFRHTCWSDELERYSVGSNSDTFRREVDDVAQPEPVKRKEPAVDDEREDL